MKALQESNDYTTRGIPRMEKKLNEAALTAVEGFPAMVPLVACNIFITTVIAMPTPIVGYASDRCTNGHEKRIEGIDNLREIYVSTLSEEDEDSIEQISLKTCQGFHRKCFPFLPLGILSLNVKDWFSLRIGFSLTFITPLLHSFVVSIVVQCSEMASSGLEHRWTKLSVRHPTRPSDQPSTSTNEHPTEQPPISSDGPPTSSNVPPNEQPSTSVNQPQ
ncbi:hypothetical protein V8G54_011533 [Vigna mungo]|uniref:Uncharacterized protein n=1 Tax=Vigna mungo TaxID=3915 RepID=A0AAQ3S1C0_VIGMU